MGLHIALVDHVDTLSRPSMKCIFIQWIAIDKSQFQNIIWMEHLSQWLENHSILIFVYTMRIIMCNTHMELKWNHFMIRYPKCVKPQKFEMIRHLWHLTRTNHICNGTTTAITNNEANTATKKIKDVTTGEERTHTISWLTHHLINLLACCHQLTGNEISKKQT